MDDPIFDPWSETGAAEEAGPYSDAGESGPPANVVPSGQSVTSDDAAGSGGVGSAPDPFARLEPTTSADRRPAAEPGHPSPVAAPRETGRRWSLVPERSAPASPPPSPTPVGPRLRPASPHRNAFRAVVRPRLDALAARLHLSGHDAMVDDRTERAVPSIRFRFVPRPGPFDEADPTGGSALEVRWDRASDEIRAELWLDLLADEPDGELAAPTDRVDETWMDQLIVEFVRRTIHGGTE